MSRHTSAPARAVIYTRVSRDTARGRSVAEQETECRAVCDREGWPVAEVICDNDRSASRYARKGRPGFDRLRATVAPGDVIVCWEASRLSRDLGDLIALRDLCLDRGVAMSYGGQLVDLDEPKFVIDGMMSEQEAMRTRDRILRAHRGNLAAGKPHGRVPYGYRIVRDPETGRSIGREPDPARAPLIVEAARRVLAGESLNAVVRWIEGADPRAWNAQKLRRILTNATYAGYRTNSSTTGGKRGPQVIHGRGTWEPILTDEQHQDLVALFAGRAIGPRGSEPRYLLSGIARCAVCGEYLWRKRSGKRKDGGSYEVYQCAGAKHVGRSMASVDAAVTSVVEGILASPEALAEMAAVPATDPTAPARLEELRARLEGVEDEIAEGRMPAATGARVATRLEKQIAELEAAAAPTFADPVVADLAAAPDPVAAWAELPLEARREFIRATMTITVDRVGSRWHAPTDGITITPVSRG